MFTLSGMRVTSCCSCRTSRICHCEKYNEPKEIYFNLVFEIFWNKPIPAVQSITFKIQSNVSDPAVMTSSWMLWTHENLSWQMPVIQTRFQACRHVRFEGLTTTAVPNFHQFSLWISTSKQPTLALSWSRERLQWHHYHGPTPLSCIASIAECARPTLLSCWESLWCLANEDAAISPKLVLRTLSMSTNVSWLIGFLITIKMNWYPLLGSRFLSWDNWGIYKIWSVANEVELLWQPFLGFCSVDKPMPVRQIFINYIILYPHSSQSTKCLYHHRKGTP